MITTTGQIPQNISALYLSHGGGPLPVLGDAGHQEMVEALKGIAEVSRKPSAIILISAHWEERAAAITQGDEPCLIYDYYGFPKAAYEFKYPVPGAPDLADRIHTAFEERHIDSLLDGERGFDHGMYIPLMLMYPDADVPCVQVSLVKSLDAALHIRIGEALSSVAKEEVLIIGSGFSFHNMAAFSAADTIESRAMNESFEDWLIDTCSNPDISEEERFDRLIGWEEAPSARYCHPREEHLLPLHVCYGANRRPCSAFVELSIINKKSSMYLW